MVVVGVVGAGVGVDADAVAAVRRTPAVSAVELRAMPVKVSAPRSGWCRCALAPVSVTAVGPVDGVLGVSAAVGVYWYAPSLLKRRLLPLLACVHTSWPPVIV